MDLENLSKPELLTLLSVLEGELEARDVVIEVLKAQQRDVFVQERYRTYQPSDPFLALQRDKDMVVGPIPSNGAPSGPAPQPNPLAVLQLVVAHCKKMQQKMLAQLAAAESRHRKVIADLEEEKRRHAQDTAEGDDVTYMLEKERERLLQQVMAQMKVMGQVDIISDNLEFEKAQVRRLEKDQRRLSAQVQEERSRHHKLSTTLARGCQRASAQGAELSRQLEEERLVAQGLRAQLEVERDKVRALLEAEHNQVREQLETRQEQLQMQLQEEKKRCQELRAELEGVKKKVAWPERAEGDGSRHATAVCAASQTEAASDLTFDVTAGLRMNGHHSHVDADASDEKRSKENGHENGVPHSPIPSHPSLTTNSNSSSPCSSPVLAKRPVGYQSSYQAGINQRFHAARHKFQGTPEQEVPGGSSPWPPRDLSPADASAEPGSKQLARHTVTQVLSRFTCQQSSSKPTSPNSSPFGTDYRNLATSPPLAAKFPSSLPLGLKSPTLSRTERGNPPPIPPKKPGLAQSPASPRLTARAAHLAELPGSCGLSSTQEDPKECGLVMSSTS